MSDDVHYDVSAIQGVELVYLVRRSQRDLSVFGRFAELCRSIRPDVIHSWGSMCSIYSAPIAASMRIPFVNGIIRDAPPNNIWRNQDFWRGLVTYPISQAVVGNSRAGLRAYRAPKHKSRCVYNGFDWNRVDKAFPVDEIKSELAIDEPFVVGMVASYIDRKDYDTFFEAANIVLNSRRDVVFVTVGSGEKRAQYLEAVSPERAGNFRILGRRNDVELLVSAFDIGVLTSNSAVHGEGISNAIMEYMALGKPVIATDAGGTREIVAEGETGFLLLDKDAQSLAMLTQRLLNDAELRRSMGQAGAERIKSEFGFATMIKAYLDLYEGLIH